MKERLSRLERRLKGRPGIVRRIVRAERASAEDLVDPRVLVVDLHVVEAAANEHPIASE